MLISLLDKNLLETALVSKFSNQLLTAIVSEAFVNGLPFDQKDLTNDDRKSLTKYTGEVLESLGGFNAISKAKHEALTPYWRQTVAITVMAPVNDMWTVGGQYATGQKAKCGLLLNDIKCGCIRRITWAMDG